MTRRFLRTALLRSVFPCATTLMFFGVAVAADPAMAQSTRVFSNISSANINLFTPCTSPIVRNFVVASNFIVEDVDLGVLATHSWREDIRITLESPAGTRQQLVNGDGGILGFSGSNFKVRLNDDGTQAVNTDTPGANHSSAAVPRYQHNFIPNAPLSVFNGQHSAGTWRLEICDIRPFLYTGTFLRAELLNDLKVL